MNRFYGFILLALAVWATQPRDAQAQFGISVGANFDNISDISGDREATFKSASGYHVGVHMELALGPFAFRPGLIYTDVGSLEAKDRFNTVQNVDVSLVEIPLDFRYRILMPVGQPYITAGPVLRFANKSNDEVDLKDFTVAGNIGFGIELNAAGLRPFVEARYQVGLQRFMDEIQVGNIDITATDDARLNTFMLRAGITF